MLKFPEHPNTRSDTALLNICVGHFARLEFATDSEVSVSFVTECASLARNFVSTTRSNIVRPPSHPPDGITMDGDGRSSELRTERETSLGHLDTVDDPAHHEYDVSSSFRTQAAIVQAEFFADKISQFACMPNVFDADMDEWSLMMELPPFGEAPPEFQTL